MRETIRAKMASCLEQSALAPISNELLAFIASGKMLRSKLVLRVGEATDVTEDELINSSAAIELVHAASLLHDDVIDVSILRRHRASFWREKGVPGAILFGDMLLCCALRLVNDVGRPDLMGIFIESATALCEAESEQELIFRNKAADWKTCLRLIRNKTGSLFGFAAYAAGGSDAELRRTLKESGYLIGAAYQIADDIYDAFGNPESSEKSLGLDKASSKMTAAEFIDGDCRAFIEDLCLSALRPLKPWPRVHASMEKYISDDITPVVNLFTEHAALKAAI